MGEGAACQDVCTQWGLRAGAGDSGQDGQWQRGDAGCVREEGPDLTGVLGPEAVRLMVPWAGVGSV